MQKFILISMMYLLVACESKTQKPLNEDQANEATIETIRFLKSIDDCNPDTPECAYYLVQYPLFKNEGSDKLNQFIDSIKSPAFDPDRQFDPLDVLAEEFLSGYREYKAEFPDDKEVWYIKYIINVVSEDADFITLSGEISEYGGGAHGNYFSVYHILSKQTGRKLLLRDFYTEDQISRMSPILSVTINPNITLFSETINPNQNFLITKDSITFIYNPYEIAPYSEGVIKLSLPRIQDLNM